MAKHIDETTEPIDTGEAVFRAFSDPAPSLEEAVFVASVDENATADNGQDSTDE